MDYDEQGFLKQRDIQFSPLHPDTDQARTAALLLYGLDGIHNITLLTSTHIQIMYNVTKITIKLIEDSLIELGFHLDNSLLYKIKRSLYHYTDETQRSNMGCCSDQCQCTREVFINRYQRLMHGCQDNRPRYWREYL